MPSPTFKGTHPSARYPMVAPAAETLRKIETGEILGASRSIRLINDAFCLQADAFEGDSGLELAANIRTWADYLIATRGALSPAVGNSIVWVFNGLERAAEGDNVEAVRTFLHRQIDEFNQRSLNNVATISALGADLLEDGQRVMAYDYSSSVTALLQRASDDGKALDVVIPESRSLDGGLPILREVLPTRHIVTFTVDAAIGQELKGCSSLLVGAELLTADGGFLEHGGDVLGCHSGSALGGSCLRAHGTHQIRPPKRSGDLSPDRSKAAGSIRLQGSCSPAGAGLG